MFIIYGRKKARIKQFTDTQASCKSCKSFDLGIKVYKDFYHIFFIPFFPVGAKTIEMRCKSCGEPNRDLSLQSHYEQQAKTPFYLFSGLILVAALIGWLFLYIEADRKEEIKFVAAPEVGDVYGIRKEKNYYFLRLSQVKGDTVLAYHSNLIYTGYVSKMNADDYFVKEEEMIFTKKELKEMLERREINDVERGYSDYEGFNRIK